MSALLDFSERFTGAAGTSRFCHPVHSSIQAVAEQGMKGISAFFAIVSDLLTGADSSLFTTVAGAGQPVQSSSHSVAEQKMIGLGEGVLFFKSSLTAPGTAAPPSGLVRA